MMRWILALLLLFPTWLSAQGAASLVADSIRVEGETRLIARGNIEVFYDGTRLSAAEVVYDKATDRLQIAGPIFIKDDSGAVITADRASLDTRLENGLLRGARLVLDQQLQLAANRIDRQDGRYNQLYKTAVTSCHVCGGNAPLWEIRAERVIHDEVEQQLYFTNATFHVRGVPLVWLPRVRLPDPTLERATGFLIPRLRNTNRLGTGLKVPYFITLGEHRDLTLTPYLSPKTRTLEARYRQAFLNGDLQVDTAFSDDTLLDETRSFMFANGRFDLSGGYRLNFDIEVVSDPAYLLDYSYSGKDRLDSAISVERVRTDTLFFASTTYFESLRDDETNAELPPIVGDFRFEKRLPRFAGGTLILGTSGDMLYRYGSGTGNQGRDMLRVGAAAQWRKSYVVQGALIETQVGLRSDLYRVWDDPDYTAPLTRSAPHAQITLRYPLVKSTEQAQHLLEPVVALAWTDVFGDTPPNEDSTRPEFDHGNLLSLSRFPGDDVLETGTSLTTGLHWTRHGDQGGKTRLTFGRIIRDTPQPNFTRSSGLQNRKSDWLLAGQYENGTGLRFEGRTLLDDDLTATIGTAKVNWASEWFDLDASYIWQAPDPTIGQTAAAASWGFASRTRLDETWALELDARYDVDADRPTQASLGLEWRNECVVVDLSVRRRFTTSSTVAPSTDYGLSVELTGFSAGRSARLPRPQCNDTSRTIRR